MWLAEQKQPVQRRVALKLIKVGMDTREVVAHFESERQALALMDHPAIAKVFDAGSTLEGRPYPHIDFSRVDPRKTVQKVHPAVVLENEFVRVTVLPAMGRVYAFFYKPTGHGELWRNDIATALDQGGNPLGFWLWIGGVEHTRPVSEHGSTFALPWTWQLLEDGPKRKTVRMQIIEPLTHLEETLEISLYPGKSYYETEVTIHNPTPNVVHYVHWINAQWTPGGHNELTDHTEFILPTDRIIINPEWRGQHGPKPPTVGGQLVPLHCRMA